MSKALVSNHESGSTPTFSCAFDNRKDGADAVSSLAAGVLSPTGPSYEI